MATRVLLTIDTEMVWRHRAEGLGWEENFARSYEPAGVGVPYQLQVLAEHGLKACFFVDPMPALAYGLEPVRRMVEPILAAGQEVQLHLHPFWAEEHKDERPRELAAYCAERQREMIGLARSLLIEAGAPPPVAFRAGSYAADEDSLAVLAQLGFRFDSSHNGAHHPWPSALPFEPSQLAPRSHGGIIELPIGQIEEKPGQLRHLQICALSFEELSAALVHAGSAGHPIATVVSHSFEFATRDGLRPNKLLQQRFVRLCEFLAGQRDLLPTAWMSELGDVDLQADARPAAGNAHRRLKRVVSQLWGGARYERPSETLTITTGGSITAAEAVLPYVL